MSEASPVPACVGIIMDGNRRWAKAKGLPKLEGHRTGAETLKNILRCACDHAIKHLVVYSFSTENWNRDSAEVSYLMDLFVELIHANTEELEKEKVCVRFVGQRERFSADLRQSIRDIEERTAHNDAVTLWSCLSYGGRAEIVAAANGAALTGEITEESLAHNLWTADMPDPDVIIRTGGQKRLSNFLPWQAVYSELFFTDTLWPDFSKEEFEQCLNEYQNRKRNFGI